MATSTPRVWFKSISLENVRSFGTKQTIKFTGRNGYAARWNIILGDNGTGKTTVLNAIIASLDTNLINMGADFSYFLRNKDKAEPVIFRTDEKFIREENKRLISKEAGVRYTELQGTVVPITVLAKDDSVGEYNPVSSRRYLFAYGALRKMSQSLNTESNGFKFLLKDEEDELVNAEAWLMQADYLRLKDEAYEKRFNTVYTIIQTLFRDEAPGGLLFDTSSGRLQIKLCTHYGAVLLSDLSLGYKTLIAWMVDFAKGMFDLYPESENPLAEPAVCLVDEIDLHLHPKFQRNIIKFLTDTFPNTQFIVTAHSPLIVQSAEDANIILLKREGDETHVADGIDVHSWRIDQILSSDLFGGIGGRSPQIEEKMVRRRALLRKDQRTDEEIRELDALEKELNELPVMETREASRLLILLVKP